MSQVAHGQAGAYPSFCSIKRPYVPIGATRDDYDDEATRNIATPPWMGC